MGHGTRLRNPCISQVVILNGVCEVKNPGILRKLRMTEWALCRASLTAKSRRTLRRRVLSIGVVLVVMTGIRASTPAQEIGPRDKVPTAYIKALSVANRFLEDWMTGNFHDALELLSRRLHKEIKDPSWFALYMTGPSNRHHLAFEII